MKGYIEATVVTTGLELTEIRQSLRVDTIDVVMDASALGAEDRKLIGVEPQTQTLLVCKSLSDTPCEVLESYEQIMTRIKEATE